MAVTFNKTISRESPPHGVDRTRWFVPETLTPLYYTPFYVKLTHAQKLSYNQLHACYFNEQITFFETSLAHTVLDAFLKTKLPDALRADLADFQKQEERHTCLFRELNALCEPGLYAAKHFHFIQVGRTLRKILHASSSLPQVFPLFLWLMLLQEERSLHFSREIIKHESELEPRFCSLYRAHLVDEIKHVHWDELLLERTWPQTPAWLRWLNARIFGWMLAEYFSYPKRAAMRVIEAWLREFPALSPHQAEIKKQVRSLAESKPFLHSIYNRKIVPKTFARMDAWPEFRFLEQALPFYNLESQPYEPV